MPQPQGTGTDGSAHRPARLALEVMAVGAGLTLVFTLAAALGSWRVEIARLQPLVAVGFCFFGLALWRMASWRSLPHAGLAVFVVAVSMRLTVLPVVPSLSDDVWRYVWDGRVMVHGLNPYAHAPADPALAGLRDADVHPRINHPELRTIYPPVAEAGFALVAAVAPGLRGMKAWILINDLALVAVLLAWSARRTGSPLPALAYAWNPLVTLEYAGNAHHDPCGMLWLVVALAIMDQRPVLSAVAFAAAVMVKVVPVVALPLVLARWPWRARLVGLALVAAGLGSFVALASGPASGLAAYAAHWRNNELVFHYVAAALGDERARVAVGACVAGLAVVLAFRVRDAARGARTALRAALLASPVGHPWYLGWALSLDPLAPSAPWALLSCLSLLNYGILAAPREGPAFHLGLAWRWLEYGLPLVLAAVLSAFARRQGREAGARA